MAGRLQNSGAGAARGAEKLGSLTNLVRYAQIGYDAAHF